MIKTRSLKLTFFFALLLYYVWFSLSGEVKLLLLFLGSVSTLLVVLFARLVLKMPFQILLLSPIETIKYIVWLIFQIMLSSIYVTKQIFMIGKSNLKSKIITIDNKYDSSLATTIFANSVTLTPGSATIFIKDGKIFIHILHDKLKAGVDEIYNKVKNLFKVHA